MGIAAHGPPPTHDRASTHRVLALVLAAAAGLALDALPPEGFDPDRELRGELQTGRVACRTTAHTRRLNLITSNATLKGS